MSYTPAKKFRLGRRLLTVRVEEELRPLPWTAIGPRGGMSVAARERVAHISYDGPKRHAALQIRLRHAA